MRIGGRNSRSLRKEKGKLISTKWNKEMAFPNLLFKPNNRFSDTDVHKKEYFFIATLFFCQNLWLASFRTLFTAAEAKNNLIASSRRNNIPEKGPRNGTRKICCPFFSFRDNLIRPTQTERGGGN